MRSCSGKLYTASGTLRFRRACVYYRYYPRPTARDLPEPPHSSSEFMATLSRSASEPPSGVPQRDVLYHGRLSGRPCPLPGQGKAAREVFRGPRTSGATGTSSQSEGFDRGGGPSLRGSRAASDDKTLGVGVVP